MSREDHLAEPKAVLSGLQREGVLKLKEFSGAWAQVIKILDDELKSTIETKEKEPHESLVDARTMALLGLEEGCAVEQVNARLKSEILRLKAEQRERTDKRREINWDTYAPELRDRLGAEFDALLQPFE